MADTTNANGGTAGAGDNLPGFDKVAVLGEVLWLMQHSSGHKHLYLGDMDWMVTPALALEQYRLWRSDGLPAAFATWGRLSPEAEARLQSGIRNFTEDDWDSGGNLWLMDMIAPFGAADEAMDGF